MATMRFGLVGVALRVLDIETWGRLVSDHFGARMLVKAKRTGSMSKARWEAALYKQEDEARSLCRHALRNLIPMAGTYQMNILDMVSQAATLYAPEEAELLYREGNKIVEEIGKHVAEITSSARKMRETNFQANQEIANTLRFHASRLSEIIRMA